MNRIRTLLLCAALSGCASDPGLVDPDQFRETAGNTVTREVSLSAEMTASNLNIGAVKCWESADLRVRQFRSEGGYVVTIGTYSTSQRMIIFLADVIEANDGHAKVTVRFKHPGHRHYAENLAAWADNSAKACDSPITASHKN